MKISDNPFIIHREGNCVYTNSGSVIYAYILDLKEIYSLSEKDYDSMHDLWYQTFKDYGEHVIIQRSDFYVDDLYEGEELPEETYLQECTKNHFKGRKYNKHYSLLTFCLRDSGTFSNAIKIPFYKPKRTKEFLKELEIEKAFKNTIDRSIEYINSSKKIRITEAEEEQLKYIEYLYLNGMYQDRFTDTDTKKMEVGKRKIGVVAITNEKQLPEEIKNCKVDYKMSTGDYEYYNGFTEGLGLKLPFNHIVNQILFIKEHHKEKALIEGKQGNFQGSRKFKTEYEEDAKNLGEYIKELNDDEKIRLIGFHYNIIFFAEGEKEFRNCESQIISQFKEMEIVPYVPTGKHLTNIYFNSLYANTANFNEKDILSPIDLQQACCFSINTTNYKSDDTGVVFQDRINNLPKKKDIWDREKKRIKARNFYVIAPTGEGKSVIANHLVRHYYESGYNIVIVDLGNSFNKLQKVYHEDTVYIKYKENEGLGLNPFYIESKEEVNPEKIEGLATFIFKMWKKDRLPKDQEAVALKKIIDRYYQEQRTAHDFPSFYSFVKNNKVDLLKILDIETSMLDVNDFLHILSEFVDDGLYSYLFKSNEDSSYKLENKRVIVFELDNIKDNKTLITIMLQMIAEAINKVVWKDRSKEGVVLFDEFAKLLKFPEILTSAEYFYQAARKQEASIGTIIQSPTQLPQNDTAEAMIENSQILYILNNNDGYKHVVERFNLSEHDKNQLYSIRSNFTGKRKYSEFFLKIGNDSNVMRLELAPEALLTFESEGREYENIMRIYEETGSMQEAIETYKHQKI